ncbi:MAG: hypothetical protein L6R00_03095 [Phycisphaerae bacterium]|nr:hypothetical protein [Phycisphaerae bacterium]
MVHLQKMHDRYAARGLFVYAIAMHDDDEAARRLNREMGITYPVFQGKGSKLGDRFAYG